MYEDACLRWCHCRRGNGLTWPVAKIGESGSIQRCLSGVNDLSQDLVSQKELLKHALILIYAFSDRDYLYLG